MSGTFSDRFSPATYAGDEPVSFSLATSSRAERQAVEVPESLFARAQSIARAYNLHLLPAIEVYAETTLNKAQCVTLLEEVQFVGRVVNDHLLAEHLLALERMLVAGVNSSGPAAILIEGP
jgi:hypothetical protein